MSRSTRLTLAARHCPYAIDLLDAGTPYDRDVFAAGIAAHAVLEGLLRAAHAGPLTPDRADRVADHIVTKLVTEGRSFDGTPEPPLKPDPAARGRTLALRLWLRDPEAPPVPAGWSPERPLAMGEGGEPVPYGPLAYYRGILDVVGRVEPEGRDEYDTEPGLGHIDYKSAPNTNASELETIQLRGQTLLVLANAEALGVPAPAFIRRQVINLFTGSTYAADLWMDDDCDRTLDMWRRDLALAMEHADTRDGSGRRTPAPGAGCAGCPFLLRCGPARDLWGAAVGELAPDEAATRYAVVDAARDALRSIARLAMERGQTVQVPGGTVGWQTSTEATARPEAPERVALRWAGRADDDLEWVAANQSIVSLLRALGITSGSVNRLGKVLYPGKGARKMADFKDSRAALADAVLTTKTTAEFGVRRATPLPTDTTEDTTDAE